MALTQDSTGYYLEPSTGQYYQIYKAPKVTNPYGYMGMGGMQYNQPTGIGGMFANNARTTPEGMITVDGQSYIPFTGSVAGINNGKRSVIDSLLLNKQPYNYSIPSIAQMFPSLLMPTINNAQPSQYTGGAGQFLGGLLG